MRRQRARNGHALLLAAGELCRVGLALVAQSDQLQKLRRAPHRLRVLHARKLHRETHVFLAVTLHEQVEALKDHGDVAALLAQLGVRQRGKIDAVDQDAALGRPLKQIDAAHERAFAGAAHADDAVNFAVRNGQVDVFQRFDRPVRGGKGL